MNSLKIFLLLFISTALIGCGSKDPSAPGEREAADVSERPEWTMSEPEEDDGKMFFVGISEVHASEQNARDDARSNSVKAAISYMGTMAKSKIETASTSYGLSSEVVDPTTSGRQYEKQVSANVTRRLKASKWYMERETDASGKKGYKYFVLAQIPTQEFDNAFKQTAQQNIDDAKKRAKEAATAQAKDQAEKAADFWKNMKEQGMLSE